IFSAVLGWRAREISRPDAASAKSKKFTPSIETRNVMLAGVHSAGAITIVTASYVRSSGVDTDPDGLTADMSRLEFFGRETGRFDPRASPGLRDRPVDRLRVFGPHVAWAVEPRIKQRGAVRVEQAPRQFLVDRAETATAVAPGLGIFGRGHGLQQGAAFAPEGDVLVGELALLVRHGPIRPAR